MLEKDALVEHPTSGLDRMHFMHYSRFTGELRNFGSFRERSVGLFFCRVSNLIYGSSEQTSKRLPSSPDLNFMLLRLGVCSYNNLESNGAQRRHVISNDKCLCVDNFPLSSEYDEPEYRAAIESKGAIEVFGFLCESGMMPRPLWESHRIKMPSQLSEIVGPAIRVVEPVGNVKLEELEPVKHKIQVSEAFNFLKDKLGPIAATKVLHVLNPDLFVPWDTDIREYYQLNVYDQDYLKFLEFSRKEVIDVLTETQMTPKALRGVFYQRGWKPLTKLVDEFHTSVVRKLPPHFSEQSVSS